MRRTTVVAVDIGASSGRVMVGRVGRDRLDLDEVHRFVNEPIREQGSLRWDAGRILGEVVAGLAAAHRSLDANESIASVGIDTWGVDYGLLDDAGELIESPFCYRDNRTALGVERVHRAVSPEDLYATTGVQFLPFNTIYQLAADLGTPRWQRATTMLLMPDLLGFWLTGAVGCEITNASTTGLLDARTGEWSTDLAERVDIRASVLPTLRRPGDTVGGLLPDFASRTGLPSGTPVVAVGSHDTASAVVAVPGVEHFAYIASGTWSLVGVELPAAVLTEASRTANFTNERGVDGSIRYLRNVMGLWLLTESMRSWGSTAGQLSALLNAAAVLPAGGPVIDPDDTVFLPPGDLPLRIAEACRRTGQPMPDGPPATVRCILDSLAAAYARAVDDARRLAGTRLDVLHVVGGGARNDVLAKLTALATGLPVVTGPVEATALGNVLVQARAAGAVDGEVAYLRQLVRRTQEVTRFG